MEEPPTSQPSSTQVESQTQPDAPWTSIIPFPMMIDLPTSIVASNATLQQPEHATHVVNILEYCQPIYKGAIFRFPCKYSDDDTNLGIKALLQDLKDAALREHPDAKLVASSSKTKPNGHRLFAGVHKRWSIRCSHFNRVADWQRTQNKLKAQDTNAAEDPILSNGGTKKKFKRPSRAMTNLYHIDEHSKKCPFALEIHRDGDGPFYMKGGLGSPIHQYHVQPKAPATKTTTTTTKKTTKRKRSKGQSQEEVPSEPPLADYPQEDEDNEDDGDGHAAFLMGDDEDEEDSLRAAALSPDHQSFHDETVNPFPHLPPMFQQFQDALAPLANELFATLQHPSLSATEQQVFWNRARAAQQQLLRQFAILADDVKTVVTVREHQARVMHSFLATATTTNSRSAASKRRRGTTTS